MTTFGAQNLTNPSEFFGAPQIKGTKDLLIAAHILHAIQRLCWQQMETGFKYLMSDV